MYVKTKLYSIVLFNKENTFIHDLLLNKHIHHTNEI